MQFIEILIKREMFPSPISFFLGAETWMGLLQHHQPSRALMWKLCAAEDAPAEEQPESRSLSHC